MSIQFSAVEFYVCMSTGEVYCEGEFIGYVDLDGDIESQVRGL